MQRSNKNRIQIFICIFIWQFLGLFSCGSASDQVPPKFDGDRAYQYLVKQCDFGPRVPGSQAHRDCLDFLCQELQTLGARVNRQPFLQKLPGADRTVTMTNIIASVAPDKRERILLCAHWDSRPWADQDANPENHEQPVPGANDGASGVAVLLEAARCIRFEQPKIGVDIIFFDAEDIGLPGNSESYALGAQYFAQNKDSRYRPKFAILLDMVGDRDLEIYQEENSLQYAPEIVKKVWNRAEDLGLTSFTAAPAYQVTDDHLPLLRAGIPCIDLIDFNYQYWHTVEDTPDKCSPESLGEVGTLILSLIYND